MERDQDIRGTSAPEEQPHPTEAQQQDSMQQLQHLLARAMKDEAWRQQLLRDPKPLLERELGMQLPSGVSIQVHEDTSSTIHLVLPPRQQREVEVADADLRASAGQMMRAAGTGINCNAPTMWWIYGCYS